LSCLWRKVRGSSKARSPILFPLLQTKGKVPEGKIPRERGDKMKPVKSRASYSKILTGSIRDAPILYQPGRAASTCQCTFLLIIGDRVCRSVIYSRGIQTESPPSRGGHFKGRKWLFSISFADYILAPPSEIFKNH